MERDMSLTEKCASDGGCKPVQDLSHEIFDKPDGLKEKVSRLVTWGAMEWILACVLTIGGGLGGIIYAKGENNSEKIEQHSKDISKLDERTKMILSSQNKTNELLQKLIDMKQDDNAKKIASKELKEYNKDNN